MAHATTARNQLHVSVITPAHKAVAFLTGDDSADLDDVDWVLPQGCAPGDEVFHVQSRCKSRNAASAPHAPGCTGHGRRMARPVTNEPPLCALDQDGSVHDPGAASMVTKCFI